MKATKRPWHTDGKYVYDNFNNVVCEMHGSYQWETDEGIEEQCRIDAELIVKCINNNA